MARTTEIAWCDSTFNPWIGCTKIGPGCDHCYAEVQDHRYYKSAHWGTGAARMRTSVQYWKRPMFWNREALLLQKPWRVFCASQADIFDNEVDPAWREEVFDLIKRTPALTWLLLSKRVGNIRKMLPKDWGRGYPNVWLGITVVNQEEFDRDVEKLLEIPARVRWLSIEPQIGQIHLNRKVDWVVCGGESGGGARRFEVMWANLLAQQCRENKIPFFMKQLGANAYYNGQALKGLYHGKGGDPDGWEKHWGITVREFPE